MYTGVKKGVVYSLFGEVVSKIPLYIAELLLVRNLSMVSYGLWTSLQVVLRIFPYFHMGVLSAYNKISPLLSGAGSEEEVVELDTSVYSFIQVMGAFIVAVSLGFVFISLSGPISGIYWQQFLLLGLIGFSLQSYIYHQARLKNEAFFNKFSAGTIVYSLMYLFMVYLLSSRFQITGVLIALMCGYSAAAIYYKRGFVYSFKLKPGYIRTILVAGVPTYLFTLSNYGLQMIDRIVLMRYLNIEVMAHYGFAYVACQMILLVTSSVGRVVSTYLLRSLGSGDKISAGLLSLKSMWVVAMVAGLAVGGFLMMGRYLVDFFFSQYVVVLEPMFFMMIGMYFFSSVQTAFGFLIGLNKERVLIVLHVLMILVTAGMVIAGLRSSPTLLSAAKAVFASQLIYFMIMLYLFLNHILSAKQQIKKLLINWCCCAITLSSPLLLVLGGVTIISPEGFFVLKHSLNIWDLVIQNVKFVALMIPITWLSWQLFSRQIKYTVG